VLIIGRTGGAGFLVLLATPVDIGFSVDHVTTLSVTIIFENFSGLILFYDDSHAI
jgi:polyisoprenoid-binding protein YceI